MSDATPVARSEAFCRRFTLELPILMAPMAGASPPALAAAVGNAGGMGGCGALLMSAPQIADWAAAFRQRSNAGFQMNLWVPDPAPRRDPDHEAALRHFLAGWGPEIPAETAEHAARQPDFDAQCRALLVAQPNVISSIMGLFPPAMVDEMKARDIAWFATATTTQEARAAEAAGADVIIAQGAEAGGHRGAFAADKAEAHAVGLFALVPAICDAVHVPVVAAGGIADARTVAAALQLGASAVMIGTALLRTPEAGIAPVWADALGRAAPEDTVLTRAFSGRAGRSLRTGYVAAAAAPQAPAPAPYPVQRALTGPMRAQAAAQGDLTGLQAWAGQSARLAQARPAAAVVSDLWAEAARLLGRAETLVAR